MSNKIRVIETLTHFRMEMNEMFLGCIEIDGIQHDIKIEVLDWEGTHPKSILKVGSKYRTVSLPDLKVIHEELGKTINFIQEGMEEGKKYIQILRNLINKLDTKWFLDPDSFDTVSSVINHIYSNEWISESYYQELKETLRPHYKKDTQN